MNSKRNNQNRWNANQWAAAIFGIGFFAIVLVCYGVGVYLYAQEDPNTFWAMALAIPFSYLSRLFLRQIELMATED